MSDNPQQPGQPPVEPPAQPGWGQPPAQTPPPGWGQPQTPPPGWGQPPAQPGWGQPQTPPPGWGQQQANWGQPQQPQMPPPGYPQQPGYPPPGYPQPGYPSPYGQPPMGYGYPPRYAGFWIRLVAYLIDFIVVLLLSITIIGPLIYFPLMWWQKGATLGQMVLNLRVVRAVDGGPIDGGTAFVRFLVFLLESVGTYILIGLLGFIWAAFDQRKQAWHDKAANTVVIHTN
jgi:uncharacterized RDD family membrane protein YckC